MKKLPWAGLLAGLSIALLWGLSFVSIKLSVAVIPPLTLGLIRFSLASLFLWGLKSLLSKGKKIDRKDFTLVFLSGLVGVTIYFFMENIGVKLTSASEASLLIGTIPVLTILMERFIFKIKLKIWHILATVLSSLGIWFLVSGKLAFDTMGYGYLYMIGAALAWVAYSFMSRSLFSRYDRITLVFWQSLSGALGFIPLALTESTQWIPIPGEIWGHVLFLAIFCSAFGYWFYSICVHKLGVAGSSVFVNLIPVIASGAGVLFLGEVLEPLQWVGAAIVVFGVFIITLTPRT